MDEARAGSIVVFHEEDTLKTFGMLMEPPAPDGRARLHLFQSPPCTEKIDWTVIEEEGVEYFALLWPNHPLISYSNVPRGTGAGHWELATA